MSVGSCAARAFRAQCHGSKPIFNPSLSRNAFSTFRGASRRWWPFRAPTPPRFGRQRLLLSVAPLGPAGFVVISGIDDGSGKTGEQQMLQASREEIENEPPTIFHHEIHGKLIYMLDMYVWEPLATAARFIHLVLIFAPVILSVPVIWIGRRIPDRDNERSGTLWWYGFLVGSMERSGAAFIKLGQWAASRTDIFPKEMCSTMSTLHSHAPAHSLRRTKAILEHAFEGRKFEDIFEEFHEEPMGVGAIAQVYKAKLKPDLAALTDTDVEEGKPSLAKRVKKNVDAIAKSSPQRVPSSYVAIKVLHPKVERTVRRDLRIMGFFANVLNAIPTMEWLSFPDEVEQFGEMMKLQLDLRIEAANLTLFRKNFKDRTAAWFPYPYTDFTTREVLVEEFAQGIPLAAFLENGGGVYQKEIADEILDAFLRMLLIDNFTHADLHPGNIMVRFYAPSPAPIPNGLDPISRTRKDVAPRKATPTSKLSPEELEKSTDVTEQVLSRLRPHRKDAKAWKSELARIESDGYRPQVIFIDTGLVTELNNTNRDNFLELFKAVVEFDGYKAGHLMCDRCRQPEAVLDREVFALRMQHLVLGVKSRTFTLGNIKIGDILSEVLDMVRGHHVRLEGDFVNVVLSILLLEGIGRTLDPKMDLFAGALPILRQLGTQGGTGSIMKGGDFSMLKVWAGLEARNLITVTVEEVDRCVKYDQLSPNV